MVGPNPRSEVLLLCALSICVACSGDAPEGSGAADGGAGRGAIAHHEPDGSAPGLPSGGSGGQGDDIGVGAGDGGAGGDKDSGGVDAGTRSDAGSVMDAGGVIDAGSVVDAGSAIDAGMGGIITAAGCMGTKPEPGTAKVCTANDECEAAFPIASCHHDSAPIDYADRPPAGGDHNPCWGTWGVHDQPLAAERWNHNLEHGAVVLLYNCPNGCPSEVDQLAAFVDAPHTLTVLTAYTAMAPRFAIVSWGYRLSMQDELDIDAVQAFYDAHVDHAPEHIASAPSSACADSE